MNSLQKTNSIFGGTSLESYERERCVGPVGGREMPWIRNQNTRCYRGSDAIKSNERISKRGATRAVCLAGWLPAWKETQGVQKDTGLVDFLHSFTLSWNPSQGVSFPRGLCFQLLAIRDTSWSGEGWTGGLESHLDPITSSFWASDSESVKTWGGGDNRFFTKLFYYLRRCVGRLITWPVRSELELGFRE